MRPFHRPLTVPGRDPLPRAVMATNGLLLLLIAGALALFAAGPLPLGTVALLVAMITLGQLLAVRFPSGVQIDSAPVFIVAAAVSLPVGAASAVMLVAIAVAIWVRPAAWQGAMSVGLTLAGCGAASILAMGALRPYVHSEPWSLLVLTAAAFLASAIFDFLWLSLEGVAFGDAPRKAVRTAATDVLTIVPLVALIQLPMAALAALAVLAWPPFTLLCMTPFVLIWRMTRQEARLAEAEHAAGTDSLTGLPNRARFFDRVTGELEAAQRYRHPLALIMGDLDNFKRVNDTQGHLIGDEVLMATAGALSGIIDDAVFPIARYGGEEFVIAIPVLEREEVLGIAERIRAAVEAACSDWGTSISLGIAYFGENDRIESLVDRADKALYSAKYAGKNRVHEWNTTVTDGPVAVMPAADAA